MSLVPMVLEQTQREAQEAYRKLVDIRSKVYDFFNEAFDGATDEDEATVQRDDVPEGHYEQDNMKETVVPNRNKIFSSLIQAVALSVATASTIKPVSLLQLASLYTKYGNAPFVYPIALCFNSSLPSFNLSAACLLLVDGAK